MSLSRVREISEHCECKHLFHFLMGLNGSYSQPMSQILMIPLPTLNKAYAILIDQ